MALKSPYRLEWDGLHDEPVDGVVKGAHWDDVRAIIEHAGRAEGESGFIILARADTDYIQCSVAGNGEFQVEYHEPAKDGHFTLMNGMADAEETTALFRAWFDKPEAIGEHAEWEAMKL